MVLRKAAFFSLECNSMVLILGDVPETAEISLMLRIGHSEPVMNLGCIVHIESRYKYS